MGVYAAFHLVKVKRLVQIIHGNTGHQSYAFSSVSYRINRFLSQQKKFISLVVNSVSYHLAIAFQIRQHRVLFRGFQFFPANPYKFAFFREESQICKIPHLGAKHQFFSKFNIITEIICRSPRNNSFHLFQPQTYNGIEFLPKLRIHFFHVNLTDFLNGFVCFL